MKLTALDWLLEQMSKEGMLPKLEDYYNAKEIEKKQAFEFFNAGQDSMEEKGKSFDQYCEQLKKIQ